MMTLGIVLGVSGVSARFGGGTLWGLRAEDFFALGAIVLLGALWDRMGAVLEVLGRLDWMADNLVRHPEDESDYMPAVGIQALRHRIGLPR
jgi:hypothetical protein